MISLVILNNKVRWGINQAAIEPAGLCISAKLLQRAIRIESHPDPEKRAERLQAQLEGRALSIEEKKQSFISKVKAFFEDNFPTFFR